MSGSPYDRLAEAMDDRRLELELSWDDVADASGKSPATLRAVRNGTTNPGPLTKRGIEKALHWSAGSIDRILEGGEPEAARPAGRVYGARLDVSHPPAEVRRPPTEEDSFDRLDRLYAEWRQHAEESEAEALRAVLESYRERKTG